MVWQVNWQVFVGGADRTGNMRPWLIDLSASDKEGTQGDSCSLTFDDTGGHLRLPETGEELRIVLEGMTVFEGVVTKPVSAGSRSAGRTLRIGGKGFDDRGKVKEPLKFHLDDASLEDFLGKAAEHAGLSEVTVDPDLASIERDYWAADGESFLHIGERLAREHFATFKIRKDMAVLVPRGKDAGLPPVTGLVGDGGNVVSWNITPKTGRRAFTEFEAAWFDREGGAIKTETVEAGAEGLEPSVHRVRRMAADGDHAARLAEARKAEADDGAGTGSVELDLAPHAQAEALFLLTGARPGVDGAYRIFSRTHRAGRSGGARTSLQLTQPHDGAGEDVR